MTKTNVLYHNAREISDTVNDDVKRSVSFRVYVSDYGKLRYMSDELRTRESTVFRFLLGIALEKCAPFYDKTSPPDAKVSLFAELGLEFAEFFRFDGDALKSFFQPSGTDGGARIDEEDFDLVAAYGVSNSLIKNRMEKLIGRPIESRHLREELKAYLLEKYGPICESVALANKSKALEI